MVYFFAIVYNKNAQIRIYTRFRTFLIANKFGNRPTSLTIK